MIIYIFLFSQIFFTTRTIGVMKIMTRGTGLGYTQSAYNLKYKLRML